MYRLRTLSSYHSRGTVNWSTGMLDRSAVGTTSSDTPWPPPFATPLAAALAEPTAVPSAGPSAEPLEVLVAAPWPPPPAAAWWCFSLSSASNALFSLAPSGTAGKAGDPAHGRRATASAPPAINKKNNLNNNARADFENHAALNSVLTPRNC